MPRPAGGKDTVRFLKTPSLTTYTHFVLDRLAPSLLKCRLIFRLWQWLLLSLLAMGACATKPGDLKVKGEAPLVMEDAVVAAGEKVKVKAKADVVPVAAAEVDQADVSRRRSLSDLLKRDAEASDGDEADHQEPEKVVAEEPASAAAAGETTGSPQAPVQASVAVAAEQDDTAEELKDDLPSGDAQAAEEEKRVDPESVQVAVAADADAPSSEESKAADDDDASA